MDHSEYLSQEQRGSQASGLSLSALGPECALCPYSSSGMQRWPGLAASSTSGGRERLLPVQVTGALDDSHPEGCQRTFSELSPGEWDIQVIISKKDNDSLSHSSFTDIYFHLAFDIRRPEEPS